MVGCGRGLLRCEVRAPKNFVAFGPKQTLSHP